jgi:uncharacterized membrane-anchored protein
MHPRVGVAFGLLLCLTLPLSQSLAAQDVEQGGGGGVRFEDIPWEEGPVLGDLGTEAEVQVPEGCLFTRGEGVAMFMELTENTTSPNERGVVFCSSADTAASPWFVVFTYDASGYVKDDDRDKLDADAILATLREGMAEGNKERERRGWATLNLDGWAVAPFYDATTNNLTWATALTASDGGRSVNHSVRLLGRGGVMHVDLVAGPENYQEVQPVFAGMVGGFTFKSGHRYAEWRSGDKVAEYGLTALVAGGIGVAAAKSGLLGKLWKLIVAGVAAAAAGLRKLFGRKPAAEPTA